MPSDPRKSRRDPTEGDLRVGRVNFGGVVKSVCLDYVPEIQVGDYTIVHVGFASRKSMKRLPNKTLADFRAFGVLEEELADEEQQFARAAKAPQIVLPRQQLRGRNYRRGSQRTRQAST